MMKISPSRQRNAASEGIALGLVTLGHWRFAIKSKLAVDMAFENAWRDWAYARLFPQVTTDLRNEIDGVRVMTHADADKHVWTLFWEAHPELRIIARDKDWNPNEHADIALALKRIDGDVPLAGWQSLAQQFIDEYAD